MSDVKRFDIEQDVVKPTWRYANGTQEPFWNSLKVYLFLGGDKDGVIMKEDLIRNMGKIPPEVRSMLNEGYAITRGLVMELKESDLVEIWGYVNYLHSMFETVLDKTENSSKDDSKELLTSAYANWALEHAVLSVLLSEEFTQKVQSQKERIRAFHEQRKKIMESKQNS